MMLLAGELLLTGPIGGGGQIGIGAELIVEAVDDTVELLVGVEVVELILES